MALSSKDAKRMYSTHSIETYANGTRTDLICKSKEIKCKNIIK